LVEWQMPPHFALLYKPEAIPRAHSITSSLGEICRLGPKQAWRLSPPWRMRTRLAARPWSGSWLATSRGAHKKPLGALEPPPCRKRLDSAPTHSYLSTTVTLVECKRCDGARWVCEQHDERPWDVADVLRACHCGVPACPAPIAMRNLVGTRRRRPWLRSTSAPAALPRSASLSPVSPLRSTAYRSGESGSTRSSMTATA
jgi:hypothetical protein